MTDYLTLRHFFGAYMHEDWHDDYPDVWAVVDDYVQREPLAVSEFASEITQLLSGSPSESRLQYLIQDDFGAQTRAGELGWTWCAWLKALADRAEQQLGRLRAS